MLACILQTAYSQWNDIQELSYTPENICENDTVIIICSYHFPYTPCVRDSINIVPLNDSSVLIDVYYRLGDGAGICPAMDSISLGSLSKGRYSIIFRISRINRYHAESDTIFLTVTGDPATLKKRLIKPFKIYPNPSQKQITLKGLPDEAYISIRSIHDREVLLMQFLEERQIIDISGLNPGFYIITLYDKYNHPVLSDKLIIQ